METNISEIYDSFLSMISDYSFLSNDITVDDINEELFSYFKKARTKFHKCRNSLATTKDEVTGEITFSVELDPFEIEILANLMIVEYLKPQILNSQTLKQALSDKDFKIYSQSSQLRELNLTYRMFRQEAIKAITEYTYLGLSDNK